MCSVSLTQHTEFDCLSEVSSYVGSHTAVHATVSHTCFCDPHGAGWQLNVSMKEEATLERRKRD